MTSDLEEVERPDRGVVQPHVLSQLQGGQTEGVKVGLVGQQLQETDDGSEAGHGNLDGNQREREREENERGRYGGRLKGLKNGARDFFFCGNEMKIHSDIILKCRSCRRNNITKEILFVFFFHSITTITISIHHHGLNNRILKVHQVMINYRILEIDSLIKMPLRAIECHLLVQLRQRAAGHRLPPLGPQQTVEILHQVFAAELGSLPVRDQHTTALHHLPEVVEVKGQHIRRTQPGLFSFID